ncbi:flavin reductase family protein [Variovorax ginsengisoli]|uniref:3-hydroxy-9,10-secoandrosta-1,3,5(10)-triene-9, 17-dione monooxygenase reductase component n=1 Tax=Variovorax ginsengisoli TaxID=363844 RepID=A0ABT9S949_9BURK|nr:flavin reductase family protein [Variovorax ginsengisoli]MDP9900884.1 3-hydroxy-9,10-secoandrosta-1,3,5(10)-triene-9,17-dione monooxygenase reductase component [Variovorax ginsengisoli]
MPIASTPFIASASSFDPLFLRRVLGSFATGVTIVTTRDAHGRPVGLTANSFSSVSLTPPLVLWSLGRGSGSIDAFRNAAHWAVHILAADQQPLSERFARRSEDRFAGLDVGHGVGGVPLLGGCAAVLQCSAVAQHVGGDHLIFIGDIQSCDHRPDATPLLFHAGRYAQLTGEACAA